MGNRTIRVLGASLVCAAVGAALPLIKLIRLRARNKHLHRNAEQLHAHVESAHQDAEQCKKRLSDALHAVGTLEGEVHEQRLQKSEDDATIKRLSDDNRDLKVSVEEMKRSLELSLAKEKDQEARIAELLERNQELTNAVVNMEQSVEEEHVSSDTDAFNHDKKGTDDPPNLAPVDAEAQSTPAVDIKPMENLPKANNPEPRLRQERSLEDSMLMTASAGEPLDSDVYLAHTRTKNNRRRKRKSSSNNMSNRNRELEKERLDSALAEYFAKETVHRRSW